MHPRDVPADMLPWSAEAESGVLGALMMNPGAWDHVGDILEQKHFFDDRNGRVFSAISGLVLSGKPADVISVHDALEKSGQLEGIDLHFLNDMTQVVTGSRNIRAHAEIVAERALLRGLLEASGEIMDLALSTGTPVADRLEQAQSKLQALQINRGRQLPVHVGELVAPLMDRLQSLSDGTAQPGISTGIPGLDRRLNGGLRPGKQMVLAARPSIGKSALALQLCLNLARAGNPAAFFSQEMPNSDNMDRVVANIGSVLLDNLLSGRLRDDEWSRCSGAAEDLSKLPLYFDDQPAMTLQDITVKARALVRTHGIKLLVIDYIQLCASRSGADKRHHQIEEISRGLKSLAKQLGITILTLSQLGRVVESRAGGKPQLSDLKESGSIEEDADIVILLSRDHVVPNGPAVIEADFVKNRQGRIGSVALAFDGGYQRWSDSTEPLGQRGKTPGGFGPKTVPYTEDF